MFTTVKLNYSLNSSLTSMLIVYPAENPRVWLYACSCTGYLNEWMKGNRQFRRKVRELIIVQLFKRPFSWRVCFDGNRSGRRGNLHWPTAHINTAYFSMITVSDENICSPLWWPSYLWIIHQRLMIDARLWYFYKEQTEKQMPLCACSSCI